MKQSLLNLHLIACSRYPKLSGCSLCSGCSYPIIWQTINFRVVLINDHAYPGYCRIESIAHINEMTDLTDALQKECLQLLLNIEKGLRKLLAPDKINLASLGNKTPHLHWHIIPRYKDDNHFPGAIWSAPIKNNSTEFNQKEERDFISKMKVFLSQ